MEEASPFRQAVAEPPPGQQDLGGGEVPASNGQSPHPEELRVDGTTQLGMIDFGGKQPQSASLTLTGGKVDVAGAFRKGDVVTGTFTAVVHEVAGKDTHDPQTGIVVSAEQRHKARIVDLTVRGAGYQQDGSGQ